MLEDNKWNFAELAEGGVLGQGWEMCIIHGVQQGSTAPVKEAPAWQDISALHSAGEVSVREQSLSLKAIQALFGLYCSAKLLFGYFWFLSDL